MATIYLSSTYEDLKDYRRTVVEALRQSGHQVIGMEDYVATDQRPVDQCLNDVEQAEIYVGLFAFRYGYVPPVEHHNPHALSITELEYRRAESLNKPCLTFIVNDTAAWPRVFDDAYAAGDKGERIKALRHYLLTEKLASQFSAAHELSTLVLAAMAKLGKGSEPNPPTLIRWPDGTSPYPGLLWFDEEYAPLFFGRDREVDELVAKLNEPAGRVLLVIGASGSGKSSMVAAGVWKAVIKERRLPGNMQPVWHRIQPSEGDTPFDALARKLKDVWKLSTKPDLTAKGTTFPDLLPKHLNQDQEMILFVDQLEELFTRGFTESDIQAFLDQMIGTGQDQTNRLRVVATIRSEFLWKLEAYPSTLSLLNSSYRYHLGPVSSRLLLEMIEKPAEATGYTFEPGLVDRLLADTGQEPGNLPLVAYALKQLFEKRKGRTFTMEAYHAIGGVVGAIATKAEEAMSTLAADVRGAFDAVFAELVHLERERPPTRKRTALSRFNSDNAAVQLIDALAGQDCRVLVRGGEGPEATVEVAHEKLFTAWAMFKDWIENSDRDLRLIDFEEECATRWHEKGCHVHHLWSYEQAVAVQRALARFKKAPSPNLHAFLRPQQLLIERLDDASLSHQDRFLIGQKLAEFGDPRPGVGLQPDGLPDIAWVEIPGGEIKLEEIDHVFKVKRFRLAKYPVTIAQFQAFVDAEDGYKSDEWWKGIRKVSEAPEPPSWQEANGPRETASWYEAVAFCRWLSHRTGSKIRLPTEWEWQQAATGGDPTREYPWPGGWDAARCNSVESRLPRTTAVGLYPGGATKQGLLDMAGNVWEWCLNTYDQPAHAEAVCLSDDQRKSRVIRGGSWVYFPVNLRTSSRFGSPAGIRDNNIGFRLVQDIP